MDFYKALEVFELTTLQNETDDSLKRKYRKLAKENHPDVQGNTNKKFQDIGEAYDVLLSSLHKKESNIEINNNWFSSYRKTKERKVITFDEFISSLDIKTRNINKLKEDYFLFLKLHFNISIIHKGNETQYEEIYEMKYDEKGEYYLNLSYKYEIGDKLNIYLDDIHLITHTLDKSHFMLAITKSISVLDTMKFMVTITQV